MTLALPTDIGQRENKLTILNEMLSAVTDPPLICYLSQGRVTFQAVEPIAGNELAREIAKCSLVFIREGCRGRMEPIIGLVANQSLGHAKIQHLIDLYREPDADTDGPPRRIRSDLVGYIWCMFFHHDWLKSVTAPFDLGVVDGFRDLKVTTTNGVSTVTLADLARRPSP